MFAIKHTASMIDKTETALMFQFNSKYIKFTIKIFQIKMQLATQYILNLLECISHIKTLQGLSNKW